MRSALVVILVSIAATASADPTQKPADAARQLLETQLAALVKHDAAALKATFDEDAVVLGVFGDEPFKDAGDIQFAIAGSPSFTVEKTKIVSLVAGGDDAALWFSADVSIIIQGQEHGARWSHKTAEFRFTELAVPGPHGSTKTIAAVIDRPLDKLAPRAASSGQIPSPTSAGPLAALLASATALDAALAKDPAVVVLGTEKAERAVGPAAAHKLLTSWSKLKLTLDGKPRELATKRCGFAQGKVSFTVGKDTYRMRGMVLGLPTAEGGWKVVAVHYTTEPSL